MRERLITVKKAKKLLYSQKVAPYVFVLPFMLSLIIFWAYPLVTGIIMSFQEVTFSGYTFIGAKNFVKLMSDKFFATAVLNSVEYMLLTLLLLIPIPMLLAVLMESRLTKARGVWKVILYIPALTSVVISGMLFRLMFSEGDSSQMNQLMHLFGQSSIAWLKSKGTGWVALLLLCMWRWTGVNMLYFVSGLKSIDNSIYESGDIDGANARQKFWYLTLPLLKPTIVYVVTISVYAGLSMFLESFMLWNGNSSPKNIGLTIVGYLYKRGIEKNDMGYACAVGVVLLVIAMAINVAQLIATGTIKVGKHRGEDD
ncbi:MAG: sugar ABC transporter permease [Clostridiales bacterium]|nr:sugar ABC transporter permease [Clostridiales bacterium]